MKIMKECNNCNTENPDDAFKCFACQTEFEYEKEENLSNIDSKQEEGFVFHYHVKDKNAQDVSGDPNSYLDLEAHASKPKNQFC